MSSPQSPVYLEIDQTGDLIVRVHAYVAGETFKGVLGKDVEGRILATMKVSRQILINNSKVFARSLSGSFAEAAKSVIDEEVDDVNGVIAIEICFRALHGNLTKELYGVKIEDIWKVLVYCDYREMDPEMMKDWFSNLLATKDISKLKLGCFAKTTRRLAYQMSDHITEENPTENRKLHLNHIVIGSVNGARGSLRTKLLRGVFDPVSGFLDQTCNCKEKSLFAYNIALSKTGIWPLHNSHKKSMLEVINSPGFIKFVCKIPESACMSCRSRLSESVIRKVRSDISGDFDGLCLDCMKKTKSGDVDTDYWEHDLEKKWDVDCRIDHGQPTWYFSFMGRRSDMKNHHLKKKQLFKDLRRHFSNFGLSDSD